MGIVATGQKLSFGASTGLRLPRVGVGACQPNGAKSLALEHEACVEPPSSFSSSSPHLQKHPEMSSSEKTKVTPVVLESGRGHLSSGVFSCISYLLCFFIFSEMPCSQKNETVNGKQKHVLSNGKVRQVCGRGHGSSFCSEVSTGKAQRASHDQTLPLTGKLRWGRQGLRDATYKS